MSGFGIAWTSRRSSWTSVAALGLVGAGALGIALLPLTWSILLVVGCVFAVVTLIHPKFGILLIVPAVPLGSLRQIQLGVINVGVTELLVGLALVAWALRRIARREVRIRMPPLVLPMVVFLGTLFLSLLGTHSLQHSVKEIVKWLEVLALYVLVFNEVDGRWVNALLWVVLGTGAVAALHGIYQFVFQVGPDDFVLFGRFMRAYGTFEQPNPYAGYLGLTLPLAVGLIAAAILRKGNGVVRPSWLVCAAGSGALMLGALVMSWSRGAWLGFAGALAAVLIAIVARSRRAAMLGLVCVVLIGYLLAAGGLALLPTSIVQRFSDFVPYMGLVDVRGAEVTDANFPVLERMAHWQSALDMWTDHPWLGVGIGNYEPIYPRYALPMWPLPLGHAHNYYLNIAAETGTVGLTGYLFLAGAALAQAWHWTRSAKGLGLGVALGVLGMLVHLSIHSLFDNLYVHGIYLQVAILMGIRTTSHRHSESPNLICGTGEAFVESYRRSH